MTTKYVCFKCGCNVGLWFYGWKHQTSWKSKKSCGQTPIPVPASTVDNNLRDLHDKHHATN